MGATNKGITQYTYNKWLILQGLPRKDVKFISNKEVEDIYYKEYWLKAGCNKMSKVFAVISFDTAVNMGTGRVQSFLREANWRDPEAFLDARERKYKDFARVKSQAKYLNGWLNRLNDLRKFIKTL